jgi:hypothetical protein
MPKGPDYPLELSNLRSFTNHRWLNLNSKGTELMNGFLLVGLHGNEQSHIEILAERFLDIKRPQIPSRV